MLKNIFLVLLVVIVSLTTNHVYGQSMNSQLTPTDVSNPPTNLISQLFLGDIILSWSSPTNYHTAYDIQRYNTTDSVWVTIGTTTDASFIITSDSNDGADTIIDTNKYRTIIDSGTSILETNEISIPPISRVAPHGITSVLSIGHQRTVSTADEETPYYTSNLVGSNTVSYIKSETTVERGHVSSGIDSYPYIYIDGQYHSYANCHSDIGSPSNGTFPFFSFDHMVSFLFLSLEVMQKFLLR